MTVENKTDYRKVLENVFVDLIKANKNNLFNDTLWHDTFTTLFEYISCELGIEDLQSYCERVEESCNIDCK